MKKIHQNIDTITELLVRIQKHIQTNQNKLFTEFGRPTNYQSDPRIMSFGYQRMIVFCAINDCINFKANLTSEKFKEIKNRLGEEFSKELMIEGLRNYPIYNFIVRYSSIIETSTKSFISKGRFNEYESNLENDVRVAGQILKAWRNTIHENGKSDKSLVFNYGKRKIEIIANEIFEFDFWTLYRISKDCSDYVLEFARMNFREEKNKNWL